MGRWAYVKSWNRDGGPPHVVPITQTAGERVSAPSLCGLNKPRIVVDRHKLDVRTMRYGRKVERAAGWWSQWWTERTETFRGEPELVCARCERVMRAIEQPSPRAAGAGKEE